MGDIRYQAHYQKVKDAPDRARALRTLPDEDLVQALAGASADSDAQYIVNVLTSEALNRIRRARIVETHIAEGVCTLDEEGRILSANPAAQRMLGWTEPELCGRRMIDLCERSGSEGHTCAFMLAYKTRSAVDEAEERFIDADGRTLDVSYTAAPVLDEGNAVGLVIAWRDVGPTRAAQRALAESEARYRSLFDHSPDLIMSVDREGRMTAINPAGERLTGYGAHSIQGMALIPFVPAEDQARAAAVLEGVFSGDVGRNEFRILDAKGEERILDAAGVPIVVEGQVVGVHGVARDITEARRLEEALRASERRYKMAMDAIRDEAIIVLAGDGKVVGWSHGATDLLGWAEEQVLGAPYAVLFAPDRVADAAAQLRAAAEHGMTALDEPRRRADGTLLQMQGAIRKVGEDEEAHGFVVSLRKKEGPA